MGKPMVNWGSFFDTSHGHNIASYLISLETSEHLEIE